MCFVLCHVDERMIDDVKTEFLYLAHSQTLDLLVP